MKTTLRGRRLLIYCNAPGTAQRGPSGYLAPVVTGSASAYRSGRFVSTPPSTGVCGRCGQRVRIAW